MDVEELKRQAAARALALVEPGMRLGLGTGSTARHFVALLGEKVRAGLKVVAVPTSEATRRQAIEESIPLAEPEDWSRLDVTVDGADEVGPDLTLIKGGGGALLREKIVAAASRRMVVIADESKRVPVLGRFPLPIEVMSFGLGATQAMIADAAGLTDGSVRLKLRRGSDGHALVTDGGHWILDAALEQIADPRALAARLDTIPGVVEHGLFIDLANTAILAGAHGVNVIERSVATA